MTVKNTYEVAVQTTHLKVYRVDAESEAEARVVWATGEQVDTIVTTDEVTRLALITEGVPEPDDGDAG